MVPPNRSARLRAVRLFSEGRAAYDDVALGCLSRHAGVAEHAQQLVAGRDQYGRIARPALGAHDDVVSVWRYCRACSRWARLPTESAISRCSSSPMRCSRFCIAAIGSVGTRRWRSSAAIAGTGVFLIGANNTLNAFMPRLYPTIDPFDRCFLGLELRTPCRLSWTLFRRSACSALCRWATFLIFAIPALSARRAVLECCTLHAARDNFGPDEQNAYACTSGPGLLR